MLDELRKVVDLQGPEFPVAELMNLMANAVKDIERVNRLTEVRVVGRGADYKVVVHDEGKTKNM